MGIEVDINTSWIKLKAKEIQKQSEILLEKACAENKTVIQDNVTRGADYEGKPFGKGYSNAYKKFRGQIPRQTGKVDLNLTGNMFQALSYKVKRKGGAAVGELFFRNIKGATWAMVEGEAKRVPSDVSPAQKARQNQARYNFFGWNSKVLNRLRSKLETMYKK